MTLKEILNQALYEVGFDTFTEFVASNDNEAQQLVALANREVNQLSKDPWQELLRDVSLTMTSATTYPLPDDYRQFIPDTAWQQTRPVDVGVPASEWLYYVASGVDTGIYLRMRIIDNEIHIQNPQPGETFHIEYLSSYAVEDDSGNRKARFSDDNDTFLLNDDLLIMGVIWRFKKAKGVDWQGDYQDWMTMFRRERGTNKGSRTLNMTGSGRTDYSPYFDGWAR